MTACNNQTPTHAQVDILEESVAIEAAESELAGVLAYPLAGSLTQTALVVGPHPLMGGRLENNVVRTVARGLAEHGLTTLRFAFAGDGPTAEVMDAFWRTGHAPDDPVRIDETRSALDWFTSAVGPPTVLVGYSFGASVLAALIDETPATHFVLISPTLMQHDFSALARAPRARLVISADNDFATPLEAVNGWFNECTYPKSLVVLKSAEHFFRNQEEHLVNEIVTWLRS